jgi:hypothetical protein
LADGREDGGVDHCHRFGQSHLLVDDAGVDTAEPERVAQDVIQILFSGLVWHDIEVARFFTQDLASFSILGKGIDEKVRLLNTSRLIRRLISPQIYSRTRTYILPTLHSVIGRPVYAPPLDSVEATQQWNSIDQAIAALMPFRR